MNRESDGFDDVCAALTRFAELPPAERRFFVSHLRPHQFNAGDALIRAGEFQGEFHFIIEGLVRVCYPDSSGRDFIKCFACEGDISGALTAWLAGEPSDVHIEALEPTRTFGFSADLLPELQARHLSWERILNGYMRELASRGENRTQEFLRLSPEERYLRFAQEYPSLVARLPQHQIAAYLGITPISLSRIRRRMGIIPR